jgi:uridine kinase
VAGCRRVRISDVHTQPEDVVDAIVSALSHTPTPRALLVGISGIDASGKGFVTAKLQRQLEERGWNVAAIGVDGWLNLPHVRFHRRDPAKHFYENAIRFDEMFARVVLPLRNTRGIIAESDFAEETATTFRKHRYDFRKIDIVILEGIFLLKPAYRDHFDLTIWIDCSFATALQRAITRSQENLSPRETLHAFETIYFAAQRFHIERDDPRAAADIILMNDNPALTNCGIS